MSKPHTSVMRISTSMALACMYTALSQHAAACPLLQVSRSFTCLYGRGDNLGARLQQVHASIFQGWQQAYAQRTARNVYTCHNHRHAFHSHP